MNFVFTGGCDGEILYWTRIHIENRCSHAVWSQVGFWACSRHTSWPRTTFRTFVVEVDQLKLQDCCFSNTLVYHFLFSERRIQVLFRNGCLLACDMLAVPNSFTIRHYVQNKADWCEPWLGLRDRSRVSSSNFWDSSRGDETFMSLRCIFKLSFFQFPLLQELSMCPC